MKLTESSLNTEYKTIYDSLGLSIYLLIDVKDNNTMILFDDVPQIFFKKEDGEKFLAECGKYENVKLIKQTLGMTMHDVLEQKLNGVSLHGFYYNEDEYLGTYISYEDLYQNRNEIETAYILMMCAINEMTNEATIYNISNSFFYYLGDIKTTRITVNKIVEKEKIPAFPLFLTYKSAKQFAEDEKIDEDVHMNSLHEIYQMANEQYQGFAIDPMGTINSYIDCNSIGTEDKRHFVDWTEERLQRYLQCFRLNDEIYVVLTPNLNMQDNTGFIYVINDTIHLFEDKEDAMHYIDARPEAEFGRIKNIGIIKTQHELKEIFDCAITNKVGNISLNTGTEYYIKLPTERMGELMFPEVKSFNNKYTEIPIIPLVEQNEYIINEESFKDIETIINQASQYGADIAAINLAYMCSVEQLMYAISYIDNLQSDKKDKILDDLKEKCCMSLFRRLYNCGDTYLLFNEEEDKEDNSGTATVLISNKYYHKINEMCFIKCNTEFVDKVVSHYKEVILTDLNKYKIKVDAKYLTKISNKYKKDIEPHVLETFMSGIFETNLALFGIDIVFSTIITNQQLFDEIMYAVKYKKLANNLVEFGGKTVNDFVNDEDTIMNAYLDFIEFICNIIPNNS